MFLDLTSAQIVVTVVAVVAGSLAQSTIGLGFGMVLVPILAVFAPDLLPAMPLILAGVLSLAMIVRERSAIDMRGLPPLLAGRLLGILPAVWLLIILTGPALEILFGVVIVVVVAMSARKASIRPSPVARFVGGSVSGLFATTAAIGGPPVAILYQDRPGPEVRSTLAVLVAVGSVLSLVGLIPTGRITWEHLILGLALLVPTAVGFALSGPLGQFLEGRLLRPAILLFAAAGGVMAIVRGLIG